MTQDLTLPAADGYVNVRVGAIIIKNEKLLMVGSQDFDYYYSVGGRIQFGESAEQAVRREVLEETGWELEIDRLGLDGVDRRMLESIIVNFRGGPVGLDTLAATIGEEAVTLEDVYEPYLLQIGFLNRTPRGRCVTQKAYEHLGIPFHGQLEM